MNGSLSGAGIEEASTWRLNGWAAHTAPSAVQQMLREATGPEFVHLALGLPASEWLPNSILNTALRWVLDCGSECLQYRCPSRDLKEQLVALMRRRGLSCCVEQVFLTTGAQQALCLLTRLLTVERRPILVDDALYPGFRQVVETCGAAAIPIPVNSATGTDVDAVADILNKGSQPSLYFFNSGPHNPLGVTLPLDQRLRLARLATDYEIPVIEDDAYGFLSYEEDPAPPLRALNPDRVCYVGSLSKILAPALRVGWIVAPEWLMPKLSILKESTDLDTCSLGQAAAARAFELIDVDQHVDNLRSLYRGRRDVMLEALAEHLSESACWCKPAAGFFVWLRLKNGIDSAALLDTALKRERVTFMPGPGFSMPGGNSHRNSMRLSYSNTTPQSIREGVRRIAETVRAHGAELRAGVPAG
jgi:2-aminoadipate transaminase